MEEHMRRLLILLVFALPFAIATPTLADHHEDGHLEYAAADTESAEADAEAAKLAEETICGSKEKCCGACQAYMKYAKSPERGNCPCKKGRDRKHKEPKGRGGK